jgi:Ca2+-binding RTX toxin-like protein
VTFSLASQGAAQNSEQGMINAIGFENLSGSNYDDFLTGDDGDNVLLGDLGNDTLRGNDGDDSLYGDGRLGVDSHGLGTSGQIALFGDIAALTNVAGGDDTLLGGRGNDSLYGGRGNDVMTGNQGDDRFIIEAQSGVDRITDFSVNIDTIVFDASSGVDSFADLTFTKVGNSTVITWGTSDSLQLDGIRTTQLDADDFEFAPAAAAVTASANTDWNDFNQVQDHNWLAIDVDHFF